MTKNPILNAFAAVIYIILVVLVLQLAPDNQPDAKLLAPIAALSLFVLSASVMGYIFLYQPLVMFLDGDRKGGVKLFLQTVLMFAGVTVVAVILAFSRILSK